MGEGFRSLPTSNERINALGSYMRDKRTCGEEQQSHVAADGHPENMGAEERPHGGYNTVPRDLGLDPSVVIALEMVDLIVGNAIQRHILTLVRIPLERTVVEPEPVWEGGSTEVKLSKDMMKLIESGKPQYTPEKKGKSKVGFDSNFSPSP